MRVAPRMTTIKSVNRARCGLVHPHNPRCLPGSHVVHRRVDVDPQVVKAGRRVRTAVLLVNARLRARPNSVRQSEQQQAALCGDMQHPASNKACAHRHGSTDDVLLMFGAAGLIRSGSMLHLALGIHFKAEGCIFGRRSSCHSNGIEKMRQLPPPTTSPPRPRTAPNLCYHYQMPFLKLQIGINFIQKRHIFLNRKIKKPP